MTPRKRVAGLREEQQEAKRIFLEDQERNRTKFILRDLIQVYEKYPLPRPNLRRWVMKEYVNGVMVQDFTMTEYENESFKETYKTLFDKESIQKEIKKEEE